MKIANASAPSHAALNLPTGTGPHRQPENCTFACSDETWTCKTCSTNGTVKLSVCWCWSPTAHRNARRILRILRFCLALRLPTWANRSPVSLLCSATLGPTPKAGPFRCNQCSSTLPRIWLHSANYYTGQVNREFLWGKHRQHCFPACWCCVLGNSKKLIFFPPLREM